MKSGRLVAGCIGMLLQMAAAGQALAADASLNLFWSIAHPIGLKPGSDFGVGTVSVDSHGFAAALLVNAGTYSLLLDPKEQNTAPIELELKGNPVIIRIAHAPDNASWLAGRANRRSRGPGLDLADPYLAKIDRAGRVVAEYI